MTDIQSALIYAAPYGKARPRVVTRNGATHTHMPDAYISARDVITRLFGPVTVAPPWIVTITAYRQMPKSWPQKKRMAMDAQYCVTKPDADNIAGTVLDALFDDDSAVVAVSCEKRWAERAALDITIEHVPGVDVVPF